jgi:hypothetical protein
MGCILARFAGHSEEKGEGIVPDQELTRLMSTLARLTNPRCTLPRAKALEKAYRRIRSYALDRGLTEEWCDGVLLLFLDRSTNAYAAA